MSHFKVLWIKSTYVVYSAEGPPPPVLVCVLMPRCKQVKVNTPHLWFPLLTHSQWKWVLFIFQTASRISDPKKKEEKKKKTGGKGPRASIHLWCFEKKDREKLQSGFMHIVSLRKRITGSRLVLIVISYASPISQSESAQYGFTYNILTRQHTVTLVVPINVIKGWCGHISITF